MTQNTSIAGGDGLQSWENGVLRFGDAFPTLCYAHGISFKQIAESFPEIYSVKGHYNLLKGESWPTWDNFLKKDFTGISQDIIEELQDKDKWDWEFLIDESQCKWNGQTENHRYSVFDQLNFVKQHSQRQPKNVLDIGSGRGEVISSFAYLNSQCTGIESGGQAVELHKLTATKFFGPSFKPILPITKSLGDAIEELDLTQFDTIVICETIEHIEAEEFNLAWHCIKSEFTGLIIITNWLDYHPIPIQLPDHVRLTDDALYDQLSMDAAECIYRDRSHLVLKM